MIIKKGTSQPSTEELNGIVQQVYEQLVGLLKKDAGRFQKGLISNWSDEKIVNRLRAMDGRMDSIFRKDKGSRHINLSIRDGQDLSAHRALQFVKLKAIKHLQGNYAVLLSKAKDDRLALEKMLRAFVFISMERIEISRNL